jgi:glycerol kinase
MNFGQGLISSKI